MSPSVIWYAFFMAFLSAFVCIILRERSPRFVYYATFGALFGYFLFDAPSVALGFYAYDAEYFLFAPLGVPVSMALAEGFCVAITIYVYEKLPRAAGMVKGKK